MTCTYFYRYESFWPKGIANCSKMRLQEGHEKSLIFSKYFLIFVHILYFSLTTTWLLTLHNSYQILQIICASSSLLSAINNFTNLHTYVTLMQIYLILNKVTNCVRRWHKFVSKRRSTDSLYASAAKILWALIFEKTHSIKRSSLHVGRIQFLISLLLVALFRNLRRIWSAFKHSNQLFKSVNYFPNSCQVPN